MASNSRLAQADGSPRVGLDMVEAGWRPTVDNYLGRVTKPRILEAVREAKGEQAAQLIDHLKKGEMAKEAERLLDGTGWLPEPLRLTQGVPASEPPAGAVSDTCQNSSPMATTSDRSEAADRTIRRAATRSRAE